MHITLEQQSNSLNTLNEYVLHVESRCDELMHQLHEERLNVTMEKKQQVIAQRSLELEQLSLAETEKKLNDANNNMHCIIAFMNKLEFKRSKHQAGLKLPEDSQIGSLLQEKIALRQENMDKTQQVGEGDGIHDK